MRDPLIRGERARGPPLYLGHRSAEPGHRQHPAGPQGVARQPSDERRIDPTGEPDDDRFALPEDAGGPLEAVGQSLGHSARWECGARSLSGREFAGDRCRPSAGGF